MKFYFDMSCHTCTSNMVAVENVGDNIKQKGSFGVTFKS